MEGQKNMYRTKELSREELEKRYETAVDIIGVIGAEAAIKPSMPKEEMIRLSEGFIDEWIIENER